MSSYNVYNKYQATGKYILCSKLNNYTRIYY